MEGWKEFEEAADELPPMPNRACLDEEEEGSPGVEVDERFLADGVMYGD